MRLGESIDAIETSATIEELGQRFQRIVETFGFANYTLIDVGTPGDEGRFLIPTRDQRWSDEYRSNRFVDIDPIVSQALRSNVPFAWSDVEMPRKMGVRKPAALKLMDAARDHGLQNGLVVPFHMVDGLGRTRALLCSFFWKDLRSRFFGLLKVHQTELHLLMIYFSQRAMEIHSAVLRHRVVEAQEPVRVTLTDRERGVLAWAARGKTVADTAIILAISNETVETHVRNAMRKLGALNKTHAAVLAMKLGLIDI